MPSPDDSASLFDSVDPRWLVEHDKGLTGQMLRRFPGGRLGALPTAVNPWSVLAEGSTLPADMKVLFGAGASAWNAIPRLLRMRTGTATPTRDAVKMRTGTDTPTRDAVKNLKAKNTLKNRRQFFGHFMGVVGGREYLEELIADAPEFRPHFEEYKKDWNKARGKRRSLNPDPLPPWSEFKYKQAADMVLRWMTSDFGRGKIPGYCWWNHQAVADFWNSSRDISTADRHSVKELASRLGLKKAFRLGSKDVGRILVSGFAKKGCELHFTVPKKKQPVIIFLNSSDA